VKGNAGHFEKWLRCRQFGTIMGELVSVIVPVYNAEKYIAQTIRSVVNQTYSDWELILVDDGSTDATCQVVEKHVENLAPEVGEKILLLHNQGKGAWSARNTGLAAAESRYIAFLDADDVWKPEKLEREVCFAQEHQAGFVFTGYEFADENAKGLGKVVKVPKTITYKQALSNTTIFTSTVLIDLSIVDESLCEMPNIKSEDTATWWRILRSIGKGYGLNENLVLYRRPAVSLSSNKFEAQRRIWNLYRKEANLSVISAAYHFVVWAFLAVYRRL